MGKYRSGCRPTHIYFVYAVPSYNLMQLTVPYPRGLVSPPHPNLCIDRLELDQLGIGPHAGADPGGYPLFIDNKGEKKHC